MTKRSILIVEDSDIFSSLLEDYLAVEFKSFDVHRSTSVEEALRRYRAGEVPSIVITDFQLGGANGMDLIRELRRAGHANPIILASAYFDLEVVAAAARFNVSRILIKPFALTEFRSALEYSICRIDLDEVSDRVSGRFEDLYWVMKELLDQYQEGRRSGELNESVLDTLEMARDKIRSEVELLVRRRAELSRSLSGFMNGGMAHSISATPGSSPSLKS
jgi:DNA-binding NtrC family response regulator